MGITRKFLSLGTGGLVDFRSDKERAARNTARTARAARASAAEARRQTAILRQQSEALSQHPDQAGSVPAPVAPAGWYPDPLAIHASRYWDGAAWTDRCSAAEAR